MFYVNRIIRLGTCGMALCLGSASVAAAAPTIKVKPDSRSCASDLKSAVENQDAGHLVEASQLFQRCTSSVCGESLWMECATKGNQLYSELPSVVPVVTDQAGEPRTDIQVRIDGVLATSTLDGRGLPVNPGTHQVSFSSAGGVFASQTITLSKGERNRPIEVTLPAKASEDKGPISMSEN